MSHNRKSNRFYKLVAGILLCVQILVPIATTFAEDEPINTAVQVESTPVDPIVSPTEKSSDLENQNNVPDVAQDKPVQAPAEAIDPADSSITAKRNSISETNNLSMSSIPTQQADAPQASIASGNKLIPGIDNTTGALQYTYPIGVPPGRNNLTPTVNLLYNSQDTSSDSVIGYGWRLSIPYISRQNKHGVNNLYTGTYNDFTTSDSGELGQLSGSNYGLRSDDGSFSKYVFSGTSWTVTTKEGLTYTYGATAAAQQDDPADTTHVYKWMLDTVTDANGNSISYTYYKHQGQIYPDTITYSNTTTTTGIFSIQFGREGTSYSMPANSATGFNVKTDYRINSIITKVSGSNRREYILEYSTGDNSTRNLLSTITEKGTDLIGDSPLPSVTKLKYTRQGSNSFAQASNTMPSHVMSNGSRTDARLENSLEFSGNNTDYKTGTLVDVNGDGLVDWIETTTAGYPLYDADAALFYRVWLGTSTGWVEDVTWSAAMPKTASGATYSMSQYGGNRITDVNGDGLPDWVVTTTGSTLNSDTAAVWLNNGSGWTLSTSWTMPTMTISGTTYGVSIGGGSAGSATYYTNLIDVNNDGLPDLVQTTGDSFGSATSAPQYVVWLNDKTKWVKTTSWAMPIHTVNGVHSGKDVSQLYNSRIIDVNGDDLPDWIESAYGGTDTEHYGVWLNNGTGWVRDTSWTLPVHTTALPQYTATSQGGDLGISQIICNAGIGFSYVCGIRNNTLADINGDGLIDWVETTDNGLNSYEYHGVWLNTGSGWVKNNDWSMPKYLDYSGGQPKPIRLGNDSLFSSQLSDINNDGLADYVASCDCGRTSNAYTPQHSQVYLNRGTGWDGSGAGLPTRYDPERFDGSVLGISDYIQYPNKEVHRTTVLQDINNDGSPDWVESTSYNTAAGATPQESFRRQSVWTNPSSQPDLLSKITYPRGGFSTVSYKAQTILDRNSTSQVQSIQAVSSIATTPTDTNGGEYIEPSITNFAYTNGKYFYNASKTWRRFAGFQKVATTTPDGTVTTNYYHQGDSVDSGSYESTDAESMIGKLYRTNVKNSSGNTYTISTIKTDKTARTSVNSDVYFVYPTQTMETTYEGNSTTIARAERYAYNTGNGNMTTKTDYGEVDPSNVVSFTDMGTDLAVTTYSYATNSAGLAVLSDEVTVDQAAAKVRQTRHYYDNAALGTVTLGNETKTENWKSGSTYVNTQKTYNSYGLPLTSKDERGKITNYTYDSYALYPATVTDALSHATQYTYDYMYGKAYQTTDMNGNVYETLYDGIGRLKNKKMPDPSNGTAVTRVSYSNNDLSSGYSYWASRESTDTGISFDTYHYTDGLGRIVQDRRQIDPNNSVFDYQVTDYTYDSSGRVSKQSLPYMGWGPLYYPLSVPTTPSLLVSYTYDPLGRVKTVKNAVGVTTYSYGDWRISVTDPNGDIKRNQYDAYGNLEHVEEVNGTSTYITYYEWNLNKKLTKITDALGNVRNFTYDGLGRRLTAQDLHAPADAVFGTWTYVYDDAGNMTQSVSPNAATVNYTYDNVNRVLTENYTGATGAEIIYAYDSCTEGVGKLCTVTMTSGANTAYTYDYNGNVASESKVINGNTFLTSYTYNRAGDMVTLTYPNGGSLQYLYKSDGLVSTIKGNSGSGLTTLVGSIGYSPDFKVSSMTYANGVVTTNTYDSTKVYRLTNKQTQNSSSVVLQSIAYTYDPVGNITSIVDSSATDAAKTLAYTYDDLSRIKTATATGVATGTSPYTESYTYDALGNILTKGSYTYSYQGHTSGTGITYANPDAVTSVSGSAFTYDNNGNMLTGDGGTVTWNYKDQVTKIANTAGSVYSYYDHTGNRVRYSVGGVNTYYPNKYYSSESGVQTNQVYLGNMLVATTMVNGTTVTPYFVHTDHILGSNVITTTSGSKTQLLDYYPFGGIRLNQQTGTFDEQNKYGGHIYDSETDLNYLGARYYKSQIGRFISADPAFTALGDEGMIKTITGMNLMDALTDPQSLNSYSYGKNNPINNVDPDGKWTKGQIDGANYLYQNSSIWKYAMDNPIKAGIVVGVASGVAAYGAAAGTTALSVQYLGGVGTTCFAICDKSVQAVNNISQAAERGYRSFTAFKRAEGPAGEGMQWHHIVEQTPNIGKFEPEMIHSTANLARVETAVHQQVSGFYSSKPAYLNGQTVRQWVSGQSFQAQMDFGKSVLQRFTKQ